MRGAIIRSAVAGDLGGVLALYRDLHPDEPPPSADDAARVWQAILSGGATTQIVADEGGLLVACCTLAIVPNLSRNARPYGVIENVVTRATHRRRGLGQAVLQAALAAAWDADCYKVSLTTGSRRETTLRFYERAGFVRDAKTYFEIRRP